MRPITLMPFGLAQVVRGDVIAARCERGIVANAIATIPMAVITQFNSDLTAIGSVHFSAIYRWRRFSRISSRRNPSTDYSTSR